MRKQVVEAFDELKLQLLEGKTNDEGSELAE
jgi:hypothetical protein